MVSRGEKIRWSVSWGISRIEFPEQSKAGTRENQENEDSEQAGGCDGEKLPS